MNRQKLPRTVYNCRAASFFVVMLNGAAAGWFGALARGFRSVASMLRSVEAAFRALDRYFDSARLEFGAFNHI